MAIPALATRTSSRPCFLTRASMACSVSDVCATSNAAISALPPFCVIASAHSRAAASPLT